MGRRIFVCDSQSQRAKSHFASEGKGKSHDQFLFYLFNLHLDQRDALACSILTSDISLLFKSAGRISYMEIGLFTLVLRFQKTQDFRKK